MKQIKPLFMNGKIAVLFVTLFNNESSQMALFEQEVQDIFIEENFILEFFHKDHTGEDLVEKIAEYGKNDVPVNIVLHHSCNHKKIAETTTLLRPGIPKEKIYYRKLANEQLQASMLKFPCFTQLLNKLNIRTNNLVAA
jgi:hypothetical protein